MNGAGGVNRLGGDGRGLTLHGDGLPDHGGLERDGYLPHRTNSYLNVRTGVGETGCGHGDLVGRDREIVDPEFAAIVAGGFSPEGESRSSHHDPGGGNPGAAGVEHRAAKGSAGVLR
jgi:hypothetical protein